MQQEALKMNGSITLEPALMLEVISRRSHLAEPRIKVLQQPRLVIVNDHRRICVQRRHKDDAVAKSTLLHRRLDLRGKIKNFARLLRLDGDRFVVNFHVEGKSLSEAVSICSAGFQTGRFKL